METVILALDGAGAERSIGAAGDLAARFAARVVVVARSAVPGGPLDVELRALRAGGVEVALEPPAAALGAAVLDAASRHAARLIVLATAAPASVGAAGGIANELLGSAPCAVVAVPPAVADAAGLAPDLRRTDGAAGGSSPAVPRRGPRPVPDIGARPLPAAAAG